MSRAEASSSSQASSPSSSPSSSPPQAPAAPPSSTVTPESGGNRTEYIGRYLKISEIGNGTYGTVYKGQDPETKKYVAIKKIHKLSQDLGIPLTTLREIAILKELSHPNIVSLTDVFSQCSTTYVVFEYMPIDMEHFLRRTTTLDPELVRSWTFQIIFGVAYLHMKRIIHRDLKPANLLIDQSGYLKIADFGLAREYSIPYRASEPCVASQWYRAPELIFNHPVYTSAIDMWSVGAIFGELMVRHPLFPGESECLQGQFDLIFSVLGVPDEDTLKSLIPSMWEIQNPKPYPADLREIFPDASVDALSLIYVKKII